MTGPKRFGPNGIPQHGPTDLERRIASAMQPTPQSLALMPPLFPLEVPNRLLVVHLVKGTEGKEAAHLFTRRLSFHSSGHLIFSEYPFCEAVGTLDHWPTPVTYLEALSLIAIGASEVKAVETCEPEAWMSCAEANLCELAEEKWQERRKVVGAEAALAEFYGELSTRNAGSKVDSPSES
jgi:hypothetical protein